MNCNGSKAAVSELKGYLKALDDFALSADRARRLNLPLNICARCLSEAQKPAENFSLLGVVGLCCHCHEFAPVVDRGLLTLYRGFHIADEVIAAKLPLLRRKIPHMPHVKPHTILIALASVIEAPPQRPNPKEEDPCSEA